MALPRSASHGNGTTARTITCSTWSRLGSSSDSTPRFAALPISMYVGGSTGHRLGSCTTSPCSSRTKRMNSLNEFEQRIPRSTVHSESCPFGCLSGPGSSPNRRPAARSMLLPCRARASVLPATQQGALVRSLVRWGSIHAGDQASTLAVSASIERASAYRAPLLLVLGPDCLSLASRLHVLPW